MFPIFERKSLMDPTIRKKACDQMLLAYKEENERLGVNVLIQYPEAMATKLRKKVLPGEQSIDPDTTNSEAKKL